MASPPCSRRGISPMTRCSRRRPRTIRPGTALLVTGLLALAAPAPLAAEVFICGGHEAPTALGPMPRPDPVIMAHACTCRAFLRPEPGLSGGLSDGLRLWSCLGVAAQACQSAPDPAQCRGHVLSYLDHGGIIGAPALPETEFQRRLPAAIFRKTLSIPQWRNQASLTAPRPAAACAPGGSRSSARSPRSWCTAPAPPPNVPSRNCPRSASPAPQSAP